MAPFCFICVRLQYYLYIRKHTRGGTQNTYAICCSCSFLSLPLSPPSISLPSICDFLMQPKWNRGIFCLVLLPFVPFFYGILKIRFNNKIYYSETAKCNKFTFICRYSQFLLIFCFPCVCKPNRQETEISSCCRIL